MLNPAQTIKILPSKINEIKEIKEEPVEESIDNCQIKKPNLKLIIPDNSNDEIEPSTSGSKLSQNTPTPSNSPLIFIEKNKNKENGKFFSLNKIDDTEIQDEDILKATPHFTGDNKTSCESAQEQTEFNNLRLPPPSTASNENDKKMKIPLTGDNKGYAGYKFTFNFETKENGAIVPKFNKDEKKILKITNQFRIANNNNKNNALLKTKQKNKYININKKIYSTKDTKKNLKEKDKDYSPLNTSINSIKYTNQESPLKPVHNINNRQLRGNNKNKNENLNTDINSNKRCNIFDTKKRIRTSRPNSVKNISPKKQNSSKNRIIDTEKFKKERKKYCNSSNKRTTILPYLNENKQNKQVKVKSKLENEVSNLFKMLPDNFYEDPEINNQMNLLMYNIAEIKEYIYKNNKCPFMKNKK